MGYFSPIRMCNCGSNNVSYELCDARGIYITRVCETCEDSVRAHYRDEIFTDAGYECDEPIEPE